MKYLYYPGCSLTGTAIDYDESFRAVAAPLGIAMEEMEGWACCGATAAKSIDRDLADRLPLPALVRAAERGLDLLTLCPSCHLNHQQRLNRAKAGGDSPGSLSFPDGLRVKQLLEVLAYDIGIEEIGRRVKGRLRGIKAVPYYGCLVIRPFGLGGRESLENPRAMERIMEAAGVQPLLFPCKTECCGGALLLSNEKVALGLAGAILHAAKRRAPDCLVVACPLCHFMLDAKQRAIEKETGETFQIPVLYLTQLLGLALGIDPARLGLHRLMTSPGALLQRTQ